MTFDVIVDNTQSTVKIQEWFVETFDKIEFGEFSQRNPTDEDQDTIDLECNSDLVEQLHDQVGEGSAPSWLLGVHSEDGGDFEPYNE